MKMTNRIFSVVFAMMLLFGCAAAEEAILGNFPERGLSISLTQEDVEMGITVSSFMETTTVDGEEIKIPTLVFQYIAPEATEELEYQLDRMYNDGDFEAYESVVMGYFSRVHSIARIFLIEDKQIAEDAKARIDTLTELCENDGYTYLRYFHGVTASKEDDPAIVEAARVRVTELLESIQYQPVVISEEELAPDPVTEVPNAFPPFTTQDLSGNTVDNSIFAIADLTVINMWGTTCYPCISEMPELQMWSEEMPENVQLIGLALDVAVGNDESIETAQMICEATGVTYPNLMYSEDMDEFASGIIFTPTTIFVDRNGSIVGEPVTGAYVDVYKAFVEEYLNAQ